MIADRKLDKLVIDLEDTKHLVSCAAVIWVWALGLIAYFSNRDHAGKR